MGKLYPSGWLQLNFVFSSQLVQFMEHKLKQEQSFLDKTLLARLFSYVKFYILTSETVQQKLKLSKSLLNCAIFSFNVLNFFMDGKQRKNVFDCNLQSLKPVFHQPINNSSKNTVLVYDLQFYFWQLMIKLWNRQSQSADYTNIVQIANQGQIICLSLSLTSLVF